MSTKNEKGKSRAEILEKLKEAVVPKSAAKKEEEELDLVLPPDNSLPRVSGRSLLSGELDNTSEKSASQLNKSSDIPAPSVAASLKPTACERGTPSTKRNASPDTKSPGRPDFFHELDLGDLDIDNLDDVCTDW